MNPGRALVFALAAALVGCSMLEPYPTAPQPTPPGKAAELRIAICYDGFAGGRAAARARAQQECPAHTVATWLASDLRMEHCPLLLPARATFACISRK